jgi:hypothetical protein
MFPRFYSIVDAEALTARGASLEAFAQELRAAGVELVQFRDKVGSPQEVLLAAATLREAMAGSECQLILNDRPDLALLANFDGVHVGQGDLSPEDAGRILGSNRIVGVSTHTDAQVRSPTSPPPTTSPSAPSSPPPPSPTPNPSSASKASAAPAPSPASRSSPSAASPAPTRAASSTPGPTPSPSSPSLFPPARPSSTSHATFSPVCGRTGNVTPSDITKADPPRCSYGMTRMPPPRISSAAWASSPPPPSSWAP